MRILITGADGPLGELAAAALRGSHEVRLTGEAASAPEWAAGLPYTSADLREPDAVEALVAGCEAVAHLAVYARAETPDVAAEDAALDRASRGTFVLLHAAKTAGVRRVVLASRLDVMTAYPEQYVVDETWRPRPAADAASLAPFLAELTLREFVRAEPVTGLCLRFGPLGDSPDGTTPADTARALERAVTVELIGHGYRWLLYHIGSTDRWPPSAAAQAPFSFTRSGG